MAQRPPCSRAMPLGPIFVQIPGMRSHFAQFVLFRGKCRKPSIVCGWKFMRFMFLGGPILGGPGAQSIRAAQDIGPILVDILPTPADFGPSRPSLAESCPTSGGGIGPTRGGKWLWTTPCSGDLLASVAATAQPMRAAHS